MRIIKNNKNIVKNLSKEKIYVVCIPYQYNPEESFRRSIKIVRYLRKERNVYPFSPILETHPYHIECLKININHNDNYYKWDFAVYRAMKENIVMIFTLDWEISTGCKMEMKWAKENEIPILFVCDTKIS